MQILHKFDSVDTKGWRTGQRLEVSFSFRIGTATVSAKRVERGSGKGKMRAFAHAPHKVWMSSEVFSIEDAMNKAIEVAETLLPEELFSLRTPSQTAHETRVRIFMLESPASVVQEIFKHKE